MEQFNLSSFPTIIAMATFWWISVYLFNRNPNSWRILSLCLTFGLLTAYLFLGVLQSNLRENYSAYVNIQRIFIWAIMFPAPAWFYFSTTLLTKKRRTEMKPLVILAFIFGFILTVLGAFTHLIYDYSKVNITKSPSIYLISEGKFYWLFSIEIILLTFFAVYNFYRATLDKTQEAKKGFAILVFGAILFAVAGTLLNLNVLFGNLYPETPGEIILLIGLIFITYSIIRYSAHFETGTTLFGKEFLLSTAVLIALYFVIIGGVFLIGFPYSFRLLVLIVVLLLLIPVTHAGYDWFMSFARNIFYQRIIEIPKVTDEEVLLALRNYNRPERLEDSSLLRLKVLKKLVEKDDSDTLSALRKLIREAVDYLQPDETERRTKSAIKYTILIHIKNQVEEGQILWDLGFEEYPLEIAEKGEGKKPNFAIISPTDYQAISRNAFLNLKKEAVHDLAWRISYLEKNFK